MVVYWLPPWGRGPQWGVVRGTCLDASDARGDAEALLCTHQVRSPRMEVWSQPSYKTFIQNLGRPPRVQLYLLKSN